jgi:hypothetical protein
MFSSKKGCTNNSGHCSTKPYQWRLKTKNPSILRLLYNKALTSVATDYYTSNDEFNYEKLKKDALGNLELLSLNEQYHILYNDMFMFTKETGNIRNEKDLEKLNSIFSNPLLQDESKAVDI